MEPLESGNARGKSSRSTRASLIMLMAAVLVAMSGCTKRGETVLAFREDGSVSVENCITWERDIFVNWFIAVKGPRADGVNADTYEDDALLEEHIRDFARNGQYSNIYNDSNTRINSIQISDKEVEISATLTVPNLKRFMHPAFLTWTGLPGDEFVLDSDKQGRLVLEVIPYRDEERRAAALERNAGRTAAGRVKVVMPGTVVSSTLPHTKAKASWILFPSPAAYARILKEGVRIVSESGGLRLPQAPLIGKTYKPRTPIYGPDDTAEAQAETE